jgi:hypothetical protein
MAGLGIATGADLRRLDLATLRQHFGAQADYLYRAARGIDLRAVMADRPRKSVGAERTFDRDLSSGPVLRETLETIIDLAWDRIARADASGRTVTLKLKFRDFSAMSRARSVATPIATRAALAEVARGLLDQVLPLPQPVRLMGVTLSALDEPGRTPIPVPRPRAGAATVLTPATARSSRAWRPWSARAGLLAGRRPRPAVRARRAGLPLGQAGNQRELVDPATAIAAMIGKVHRLVQRAAGLFGQFAPGCGNRAFAPAKAATGQHPRLALLIAVPHSSTCPAELRATTMQPKTVARRHRHQARRRRWARRKAARCKGEGRRMDRHARR